MVPTMKRSAGVTVIAMLALLGSAFIFAMGVLMLVVMSIGPDLHSNQLPGTSPVFMKTFFAAMSLVYFLPAIWGLVTGIGLWRLKNWARLSTIVFSVLLLLGAGFGGLISLLVPLPAVPNSAANPSALATFRIFMGVFWLSQLGIGIWWLVFFNRSNVKQQFRPTDPVAAAESTAYPIQTAPGNAMDSVAPERPVSITILAWWLLAGCLFIPLAFVLRTPAILFTKLLTGWQATLFLIAFAVANLCIGIGLLRLRPAARTAAVVYFAFGLVNAAVFYFAPGGHARILALMEHQQSLFPWMRMFPQQPAFHIDPTPFVTIGAVAGLIGASVPLYFLITRKDAFEKAASDKQAQDWRPD
jgi:hypothetical protein